LITTKFCDLQQEKDPGFWNAWAQRTLRSALTLQEPNRNIAKNLILFLGDGMGVPTVTAARILKGQLSGQYGEEVQLEMDKFPYVSLSKTYNTNAQVPDSAGTATAYLCGVKANEGTVGVSAAAVRGQCNTTRGNEVTSILKWAKESVGCVINALRGPSSDFCLLDLDGQVIMGGGRKYMLPKNTSDVEYPGEKKHSGTRKDGRNLIQEWTDRMRDKKGYYVWNKKDLLSINPSSADYLLGLFEPGDLQYDLERDSSTDPSLTEMVEVAIKILRKNPEGFYLLVEGFLIQIISSLTFPSSYVLTHISFLSFPSSHFLPHMSLLTFSSSHVLPHIFFLTFSSTHFLTYISFPRISFLTFPPSLFLPYPQPQYKCNFPKISRSSVSYLFFSVEQNDYQAQSAVPLRMETHGGEDVAVFSKGPMAHLLHGVQEQNYIPHAMAYAACIGQNRAHCRTRSSATPLAITTPSLFLLITAAWLLC
uniref:Alkaline phosphatase n=1 Tax=Astyanax mexicanus TaxID=7994 RepID=A0A8B9GM44_ASTMX